MRRLKVQPKYIVNRPSKNPYVPQIMLQGEWLRITGFDCAAHVIVTEEPERLIIQLETAWLSFLSVGLLCLTDFAMRLVGENVDFSRIS